VISFFAIKREVFYHKQINSDARLSMETKDASPWEAIVRRVVSLFPMRKEKKFAFPESLSARHKAKAGRSREAHKKQI
jgi:hypothetical protein